MPEIVSLPGRSPRPRKRPGRDYAAVLAAAELAAAVRDVTRRRVAGMGDQPHLSYNCDDPHRTEHARHLNERARQVVGVARFAGYHYS